MREIICDLNGFILKKSVYVFNGEALEKQGEFSLEDLKDAVHQLAEEYKIYTIRILGNDKYAAWLGQLISAPNSNFAEKKFTIKFNNED